MNALVVKIGAGYGLCGFAIFLCHRLCEVYNIQPRTAFCKPRPIWYSKHVKTRDDHLSSSDFDIECNLHTYLASNKTWG